MRILVLDDATWELAKKKIEQELNCADAGASFCRGFRKRLGTRHYNEARARKRHIEALRLAGLLSQ